MIAYNGTDVNFPLTGKTAIITGGAAGIGLAAADFFSKKGVNLILADLNPDVDESAKKLGEKNIGVIGDICDSVYRAQVITRAVEVFGGFDILINSAGIVALDAAEQISEDMWDRTIDINLTASFRMAQAAGEWWIKNGRPAALSTWHLRRELLL